MNYKILEETIDKIYCALDLKRKVIGVKLIYSEKEFSECTAKKLKNKMTYCTLVKLASSGYTFKADLDNFACLSAARALGIIDPTDDWLSGCQYRDRKMYQDLETSQKVVDNTTNIQQKVYGILVGPIEKCSFIPDVAIIITTPYNSMRLIQGYTYKYGTNVNYKIIGNQAICSECTAYPFENNDINISMLCSGTRHMAGWDKDEMAIGIPIDKFIDMVDGVYETINIMEPNKDKTIIDEKLKKLGRKDLNIEYDKNYYTGLYLK
ncbi:hypothetical protein DUF169 [Gottschalkia acidurici 9a]|uniref:DUF169 domain-containing protein n=1 Tax=Gottschalkia acidurici (strain ATCC 7906 / DSM 604 / BCRC 14475 / CIP 104303 / KCTC 5404 / NCIMB 10678 / 9a) TaxID=1128398 RepID=K0AY43_GOTA9|nr:DUF169 domain-containing protein [Gottschalkia acidurici]AFS78154.1 hypothetical protein DUF169 [Gottschalkia acidurici 9a]